MNKGSENISLKRADLQINLSIVVPAPPYLKERVPVVTYLEDLFQTGVFKALKRQYRIVPEIIVAYGSCPSIQRNRAVEKANGRIIYFLDSDAFPEIKNFEIIGRTWFSDLIAPDSEKVILGGPSLTPLGCSFFQKAETLAFTSGFGGASVKSRYSRQGNKRPATENDLILCNMVMTKSLFNATGGFNEQLYPNEENEFMERALKGSATLMYDPMFSAARYQRPDLRAFSKQLFTYGRGRADQFFQEGAVNHPDRLVPLGFTLFALLYPFFKGRIKRAAKIVFMLYFGLGLGFAKKGAKDLEDRELYFSNALALVEKTDVNKHKMPGLITFSAFLFPVMHLSYGTGMACGIIMNFLNMKKHFSRSVEIEEIR